MIILLRALSSTDWLWIKLKRPIEKVNENGGYSFILDLFCGLKLLKVTFKVWESDLIGFKIYLSLDLIMLFKSRRLLNSLNKWFIEYFNLCFQRLLYKSCAANFLIIYFRHVYLHCFLNCRHHLRIIDPILDAVESCLHFCLLLAILFVILRFFFLS